MRAGRADFQHGNAARLFQSIRELLFTLTDACIVYPGHDYEGRTSSTIGEERVHKPRIGGAAREEDFVGYMNNLGLPHPMQLAVALPANMRSGQPEDGKAPTTEDWAPVVTTYAGFLEVAPDWVASNRQDIHLLDVRTAAEFDGELGHVHGTQLIPLDDLRTRISEVPNDKPVVVICQTGKRSALGALILRNAGYRRVANVAGGMFRWRDRSLRS